MARALSLSREALMLVLRTAAASPFARKVRIVASVLGLDDRIEISAADTSDPEDSLRRQNPLGKIPTLILENGERLFDSAVIVEYLDWLAGGGKVIPSEPQERFRTLTQQSLADGIADAAVLLRYESFGASRLSIRKSGSPTRTRRSPARLPLSRPGRPRN